MSGCVVDVGFDVRRDAGGGDPDRCSPTLRRYHRLLWSKPLPGGARFDLDDTRPGAYLYHRSQVGEFVLTSDSVIPTFTRWKSMQHIVGTLPEDENETFRALGYTIGGMVIWPGNVVDGKQTINGARGFNRQIADRFDLTLECIRRHYVGGSSPLAATLARYAGFFALFEDFAGYVDFFLLHDLVEVSGSRVRFFTGFDDFTTPAVPGDVTAYQHYRKQTIAFVKARNQRIHAWASAYLSTP